MGNQPVTNVNPSNLHIETSDLLHLLGLIKNEIKTEINCHAVGTLQSFDPVSITGKVTFNYQKVLKKRNAITPAPNQFSDVVIAYPILVRVPIVVLGGSNGQVTVPISQGDPCVVLFCDRDIDLWLENGSISNPPNTDRLHDLSDAVALVGLNPVSNDVLYYTDGIYLRSAYVQATQNFEVGNGATGAFVSSDGQTITVSKGVIISIV